MARMTTAPRASRMRTIWTGEKPYPAILIHRKTEPQMRLSAASRAYVALDMGAPAPGEGKGRRGGRAKWSAVRGRASQRRTGGSSNGSWTVPSTSRDVLRSAWSGGDGRPGDRAERVQDGGDL